MHQIVYWIAAPLLSAIFGYLLWQAVKTRAELLRVLGDEGQIAGLLDGRDWRKAALEDRRVRKAVRDRTQLAINTHVLFRSFELGMLRVAWTMAVLLLAVAVASAVLVSCWLGALALAVAGMAGLFDLHTIGERKAGRDITALAMSMYLWYDYDAVICENVNLMAPRFEKLLAYVKARFPTKAETGR